MLFALFAALLCFIVRPAQAQIEPPLSSPDAVINVSAARGSQWRQGAYEVWYVEGNCVVHQGDVTARAREMILWIDRGDESSSWPYKVIAYLEGDVSVDYGHDGPPHAATGRRAQTIVDQRWLGRFHSTLGVTVNVPTVSGEPAVKPPIFFRGMDARQPAVSPAQFQSPQLAAPPFAAPPGQPFAPEIVPLPPPAVTRPRRVLLEPRGPGGVQARSFTDPNRNEQVTIVNSGVRITIEGVEVRGLPDVGRIVILADRLVSWTTSLQSLQLSQQSTQTGEAPLEFYLEGNIVFAQGDRVVYADRMYYDVRNKTGTLLNAEALTPVPEYEGLLRLKADVLQQVNEQNFQAYGAAFTSSRIGVPRYWFQSQNVAFQDIQTPTVDPLTGQPAVDPRSGSPLIDHQLLATSRNNFIYLGGVPVFYWPVLATDVTKPTYYLSRFSIKSDRVFGTQVLTDFDVYQLLGMRSPPSGTDWNLAADVLSQRGLALGTRFQYQRDDLFGLPGPSRGFIDAWGLHDGGLDNLGLGRRSVVPDEDFRGRVLAHHRQNLANGFQLTGEFGLISDRNFLEQFYEREWDTEKDQTTGLELKRLWDNNSLSIAADVRLNDFFTQTEQLPRVDHFLIGQSLLLDRLTWHAHSHAGYYRLRTVDTPPSDAFSAGFFTPMAWEANVQGLRAGTRQELDMPVELGPVKTVPYVLGDVTYWEQDRLGNDVLRAYGQVGIRATLPIWRADPTVQSVLLNLNGLAHKVDFEAELFYADASQDLSRFPLYDPLDDDAQEFFRRQLFFGTFAGSVPAKFDERLYAFRNSLQGNVTSPATEIADDLMVARLGVHQRWQTKRGMPGQERVVDYISLDIDGALFPKASRDNFGEEVGLLNYDFRWHVGDRVTLLSDGFADVFGQGLRTASIGGVLSRPEVGNLYLGFRSIDGPITSNAVTASMSYRMSEKWIASAGATVDFGPTGNIGQTVSFTRVGESFLLRLGFNADVSRGNIGAVFSVEPRFLPRNKLGQVGGVRIPPAGALGLE